MAKLKMKRLEMLALQSDSKSIVDLLQRRGVVELCDEEPADSMYKFTTSTAVSQFEKFLQTALNAQQILISYAPQKKSLLESFSARREMSVTEFLERVDDADDILDKCGDIIAFAKQIDDAKASVVRTEMLIDALKPWLGLDIPTNLTKTGKSRVFIGSLPNEYTSESLLSAIAQYAPECDEVDIQIVSSTKIQTCAVIIAHEKCAHEIEQALRQLAFVRPPEIFAVTPKQRTDKYLQKIADCEKAIDDAVAGIKSFEDLHDSIEFLIDYLTIRKEKYDALKLLSMSNSCFVLAGYIAERDVEKLVEELEGKFTVAITVTDPDEDEDPPVFIENDGFSAPVESITEMYSSPSNADIDPNPVMAFFYYAFFGLMLSDAGYGLVMVIAMLIAKKKIRMEDKMKKTVNMFLYCGLSTVFWGAMFGSWFGDIVPVICENFLHIAKPRMYIWMSPVDDPMKLLPWCLIFGIVHLFAGIAVRAYQLIKDGRWVDAICDCGFVYLFVLGLAPIGGSLLIDNIPASVMSVAKVLLIIGSLGIVLTSGRSSKNIVGKLGSGLYGLYNTASGYLGDILSYSRLLALGLATGVIANVFNMMGVMPQNMVFKAILLTVVFVLGHTLNIAINLVGAYVHTNRLQYVEFFSKFYEGGGRSFTPLSVNTKYFKFKEEINNG